MPEIRTILCAVDFSEISEQALEYAFGLAAKLGAKVEVVHVCQLPAYLFSDGAVVPPADFEKNYLAGLQKKLDDLVTRYSDRGVEVAGDLLEGIPYEMITRCAQKRSADLIVMGTHGRTGLAHMLLGSVAERVVRSSTVPVLTYRTPH